MCMCVCVDLIRVRVSPHGVYVCVCGPHQSQGESPRCVCVCVDLIRIRVSPHGMVHVCVTVGFLFAFCYDVFVHPLSVCRLIYT